MQASKIRVLRNDNQQSYSFQQQRVLFGQLPHRHFSQRDAICACGITESTKTRFLSDKSLVDFITIAFIQDISAAGGNEPAISPKPTDIFPIMFQQSAFAVHNKSYRCVRRPKIPCKYGEATHELYVPNANSCIRRYRRFKINARGQKLLIVRQGCESRKKRFIQSNKRLENSRARWRFQRGLGFDLRPAHHNFILRVWNALTKNLGTPCRYRNPFPCATIIYPTKLT